MFLHANVPPTHQHSKASHGTQSLYMSRTAHQRWLRCKGRFIFSPPILMIQVIPKGPPHLGNCIERSLPVLRLNHSNTIETTRIGSEVQIREVAVPAHLAARNLRISGRHRHGQRARAACRGAKRRPEERRGRTDREGSSLVKRRGHRADAESGLCER